MYSFSTKTIIVVGPYGVVMWSFLFEVRLRYLQGALLCVSFVVFHYMTVTRKGILEVSKHYIVSILVWVDLTNFLMRPFVANWKNKGSKFDCIVFVGICWVPPLWVFSNNAHFTDYFFNVPVNNYIDVDFFRLRVNAIIHW